ncbi:MAG: 2-hydroxyacid dehydrogenase [Solirubrobacteraceae bacterium]
MARCLITRRLPGAAVERLAQLHEVLTWEEQLPPSRDRLLAAVADVDGLLCLLSDRVDAELLAAAPRLRVISNYAVGCDNVDLDAARARLIPVGVTPDVLTGATADLALALLLALARRLPEAERDARDGRWVTWEPRGWLGLGLAGATLAVVGPGRIGRAVGARASAFGMEVRHVGRDDDLHAELARADAVSLHAPLNAATRHMIDERALRSMKRGALLINTGRGGLVDQPALIRALREGWIAGAGLDVTDPEPPPPGDPILQAPNLILLPHIGSATRQAREAMSGIAVENLLAGLEGRPLPHPAPAS